MGAGVDSPMGVVVDAAHGRGARGIWIACRLAAEMALAELRGVFDVNFGVG